MRVAAYITVIGAVLMSSCQSNKHIVTIFAAASMGATLDATKKQFTHAHADVDIHIEQSGSRLACTKVTEQGRHPDILISADHELAEELIPTYATFSLTIAHNPLVLAYTPSGRVATRLANLEPWQ